MGKVVQALYEWMVQENITMPSYALKVAITLDQVLGSSIHTAQYKYMRDVQYKHIVDTVVEILYDSDDTYLPRSWFSYWYVGCYNGEVYWGSSPHHQGFYYDGSDLERFLRADNDTRIEMSAPADWPGDRVHSSTRTRVGSLPKNQ